jgi:peptidoglycan/LPS O-acetylase OafA/YrhL
VAAVAHKAVGAGLKWQKIPELDGVRGLAILMVLVAHGFGLPGAERQWTGIERWIVASSHFGIFGVDLFFVLSGCLITGILLDSRGRPHYLRNFYGRRALRIWPLYYGLLLLLLLLTNSSWGFVGLSVIYLSNLTPLFGVPMAYSVLWSLSVEEHFYLVWPWIVKGIPARRLALVAMGIIVAEPLVRLAGQLHGTDVSSYSWFRLDGLAWGASLAIFIRSPWYTSSRLRRLCASAAALGILLVCACAPLGIANRHSLVGAMFQFSAASLVFAAVVGSALLAAGSPATALLRSGFLSLCGELSYCIYLIHLLIFGSWDKLIEPRIVRLSQSIPFGVITLRTAVVLPLTFGVAWLSFRYYETPFLRMKRYFPS